MLDHINTFLSPYIGIDSYDSTTITATSSSYVTLCSTTASTVPGAEAPEICVINKTVYTHVLSIVGTSDASSNAVQTWQGSTFALGILLAACIGIITGMCVIIIMRNFRKKKTLPNQLTGKEMQASSFLPYFFNHSSF